MEWEILPPPRMSCARPESSNHFLVPAAHPFHGINSLLRLPSQAVKKLQNASCWIARETLIQAPLSICMYFKYMITFCFFLHDPCLTPQELCTRKQN